MPKASSPVRIQAELMRAASAAGKQMHRSAAEQIEYWASIGKSLSGILDPDKLLDVVSGLATIEVKPIEPVILEFDSVVSQLETDRANGVIEKQIQSLNSEVYQASTIHPGYLERIDENGKTTTGMFKDGDFVPL